MEFSNMTCVTHKWIMLMTHNSKEYKIKYTMTSTVKEKDKGNVYSLNK
jgi:hypothetical protein